MTETKMPLINILTAIGFELKQNKLVYNFRRINIIANQTVNQYFQECIIFYGSYFGNNRAVEIDFQLPFEVDTFETGLALIAFNLKDIDLVDRPEWLQIGLTLQHILPWKKECIAYNAAPKALIEYEWFRLLIKKLRKKTEEVEDSHITIFSFENGILKVVSGNEVIALHGSGNDWNTDAKIKTKTLDILPKRISKRDGLVYIWKGELNIDRCRFEIL
jgi:hypothetical protein